MAAVTTEVKEAKHWTELARDGYVLVPRVWRPKGGQVQRIYVNWHPVDADGNIITNPEKTLAPEFSWGNEQAETRDECHVARSEATPYKAAVDLDTLNKSFLRIVPQDFADWMRKVERDSFNAIAAMGLLDQDEHGNPLVEPDGTPKKAIDETFFAFKAQKWAESGNTSPFDAYQYMSGDITPLVMPMKVRNKDTKLLEVVPGKWVVSTSARKYWPPPANGGPPRKNSSLTATGQYNADFTELQATDNLDCITGGLPVFGVSRFGVWKSYKGKWKLSLTDDEIVAAHPDSELAKMCIVSSAPQAYEAPAGTFRTGARGGRSLPVRPVAQKPDDGGDGFVAVGGGGGGAAVEGNAAVDADGMRVVVSPNKTGGSKRGRETEAAEDEGCAISPIGKAAGGVGSEDAECIVSPNKRPAPSLPEDIEAALYPDYDE